MEQSPSNAIDPGRIMQIGMGFWGAKTLLSAVELGLFTTLGAAPLNAETLRKRIGIHERSARDFFDALVALGLLQRNGDLYSNTPETGLFLDRNKPGYIGGFLEMGNSRLYPFWGKLTDGLKTGRPQNEAAAGGNPFDALYADPERLRVFLASMTGISLGTARIISQKFPWADFDSFIDIGCAQGGLVVEIAKAHPNLRGGGFDLPVVGPIFDEYVARFGLSQRIKFQPGDFMKDPLPKASVLVMGHILHDWDLETKMMLIGKACDALPKGGAILIYEALIDDERRKNAFGLLMSLNMLIETPGGFDFTGADCRKWLSEAGFSRIRVEDLDGAHGMVIGYK